jgi:hypothetical protein
VKPYAKVLDFNNTQLSGEKAAEQLLVIIQCFQNFKQLDKNFRAEAKKKGDERSAKK